MKLILLILLVSAVACAQDDYKQWARLQNIPREVREAFARNGFDTIYVFTFHVNPCYLRGDFNGDKVADYAVLVNQKASGKTRIAYTAAEQS